MSAKNTFYFLASAVIIGFIFHIGRPVLKPLVFAVLLAIMLSPIQNFFDRITRFKLLSIFLTIFSVLIPLSIIITIFSIQSAAIFESTDIAESVKNGLQEILLWVNNYIPITVDDINERLESMSGSAIDFVSSSLSSTVNTTAMIFLSLIFLVFLMWYRRPLTDFLVLQFPDHKKQQVRETLHKTKKMLVGYISGIGIVMLIMSVINSIGLYLIGVDYPIFFGVLAAMLAIVPYLGTSLGGFLPFIYALAMGHPLQALAIGVFYFTIQQIEGNFITPKIVGDSVSINPFVAILGMAIGAIYWGVAGVILAFPIIGLMRIIFYEIYALRPLALIIGNQIIANDVHLSDYDEKKFRISSLFSKKS